MCAPRTRTLAGSQFGDVTCRARDGATAWHAAVPSRATHHGIPQLQPEPVRRPVQRHAAVETGAKLAEAEGVCFLLPVFPFEFHGFGVDAEVGSFLLAESSCTVAKAAVRPRVLALEATPVAVFVLKAPQEGAILSLD